MYGRIAAVYAANPYVHPPAEFASDPFLAWVFPFWRDQPSVYGPGWTDFSWLPSALTADRDNFGKVFSVNPLPQGNSSSASTGLTLKISRKVVSSRLLLETHRQSASGQSPTAKT